MSKEKQIEEIANDINKHCCSLAEQFCGETSCNACLTMFLYTAGYRKQSEGRWKGAGLGDYLCSECWSVYSGGDEYNFCPHCGAKMKGENQ